MSESKEAGVPLAAPEVETRVVEPVSHATAFLVRGAIIGTGLAGIAFFLRTSRLFSKFTNVSQIPKEFVRKEFELKGQVTEVLPAGILKVEHVPIMKLPRMLSAGKYREPGFLNVRIAGLDITDVGTKFLSNDLRLENKKILFTPIKICGEKDETIDADIILKKKPLMHTDVNVELVRRGYARVLSLENPEHKKALQEVPAYSRLVSKLLMSEKIANRRGVGIWQRDTWVESVAAYPSQFFQIVKHSAISRFMVLSYFVAKDVCKVGFRLAEQIYYIMLASMQYLRHMYRLFTVFVNRTCTMYNRLKQKFGR